MYIYIYIHTYGCVLMTKKGFSPMTPPPLCPGFDLLPDIQHVQPEDVDGDVYVETWWLPCGSYLAVHLRKLGDFWRFRLGIIRGSHFTSEREMLCLNKIFPHVKTGGNLIDQQITTCQESQSPDPAWGIIV